MQKKEEETKEIIKMMKSNWVKTASFLLQESCKLPLDSKMTTLKKLKPRAASSLARPYRNPNSINYSNINLTIPNK
jgi:hypothetical protein